MKKNIENTMLIEGYIAGVPNFRALSKRTGTDPNKATYKQNFFTGNFNIAIDEAGTDVITVSTSCVREFNKNGTPNRTYQALEAVFNAITSKSCFNDLIPGTSERYNNTALKVRVEDARLVNNEYYTVTEKDGELETELKSSIVYDLHFGKVLTPQTFTDGPCAVFKADVLINGMRIIDFEDSDRRIGVVKIATIDGYSKKLFPLELTIENEAGIDYVEGLEPSPANPIFVPISGRATNAVVQSVAAPVENEWGVVVNIASTKRYERKTLIEGMQSPYELGEEATMTEEELSEMVKNLEVERATLQADAIKRYNDKKTKAAAPATPKIQNGTFGGF